jgi:glycosylphosphatidylinositol transamidase (GPIT) subunit GPI8
MIDTCQAATMAKAFRSPNILAISSSLKDESSYSYTIDKDVGVALIDRFTWKTLDFFSKKVKTAESNATIQDLMDVMDFKFLSSTASARKDLFPRELKDVKITEFFSNEKQIQLTKIGKMSDREISGQKGYKIPDWISESPLLQKSMLQKNQIKIPEAKMVQFGGEKEGSIFVVLFLILLVLVSLKKYLSISLKGKEKIF